MEVLCLVLIFFISPYSHTVALSSVIINKGYTTPKDTTSTLKHQGSITPNVSPRIFNYQHSFTQNSLSSGANFEGFVQCSSHLPCVLRLFHETDHNFLPEDTESQLEKVHLSGRSIVLNTFAAPYPEFLPLDTYYSFRAHLKYQLGCEVLLIYHISPSDSIRSLINLQSMRNARVYSSEDDTPIFETESINILTISLQHASQFDILQQMNQVIKKTSTSRGDSLRNRFLRISFYDLKPQYYHANGKTVGIAYEMVVAAARWYNFTFSITLDPAVVTQDADGKLRGMENEVIYGRIDMNFLYAPTFLPPGANVEASTYYSPASIIFLAQLPTRKTKWTAILYAFQLETWLVTLATCIVLGLIIFVTIKFSKVELSPPNADNPRYCKPTSVMLKTCQPSAITASFAIVFHGLLGQEIAQIPKSARALTILWLFTSLVLTNYYCSNLLSLLTYPEIESVPNDMVDLAQRDDYKVVGIDLPGGSMEQYFNKSTSWELVHIWKRTTFLPMVRCVTEAVVTPRQVCLGWDFMTEGFLQTNATINERFYPAFKSRNPPITVLTCVVLQKNSQYTDGINEVVGWCRDAGLYYKWLYESERLTKLVGKSWLTSEGQRNSELTRKLVNVFKAMFSGGGPEPFKLHNLRAPFILLVVGCAMGMFALGAETWMRKFGKVMVGCHGYGKTTEES